MTDPRKPYADALRAAGLNFNRAGVVDAFDALMDKAGVGRAVLVPDPILLTTSDKGIALIHSFEGFARKLPDGRVQAYPDPATGDVPWTIGWGATTDESGHPIRPGAIWTKERADARFKQHLGQFERNLRQALNGAPTTQNQFDAMVSLIYNIGPANFRTSTLLKKHKAGDYAGAAQEFLRWDKAAGRKMAGLTRRRIAEADLYRGLS